MSQITVQSLVWRVLQKLNEATQVSDIGSLHTGDGTLVVSTATPSGGTGYPSGSGTTVTFSAPGGAGGTTATGTVTVVAGVPAAINVTYPGSGYLATDNVTAAVTGSGGSGCTAVVTTSDPITSNAGIVLAMNNAKNLRFRQVFAHYGQFTTTWLANQGWCDLDGAGVSPVFVPVTSGSAAPNPGLDTGSVLWWPRIVYWPELVNSVNTLVPLAFVEEAVLRLYDPSYQVTTVADDTTYPTAFYRRGSRGVGIYPAPLQALVTVTAEGWAVPPDMSAAVGSAEPGSAPTIDWIDPSRAQLLVVDAACEMIEKNLTDAQIGARLEEVKQEQVALLLCYRQQLSAALIQPGAAFGTPPVELAAMAAAAGSPSPP